MADAVVRRFHHLAPTVRDLGACASWHHGLFDVIQLSIFHEGD